MHSLSEDFAAGLFSAQSAPCLSLYQPTHRHHPSKRQDPIRFRNLVASLEEEVGRSHAKRETEDLLAPFHKLGADEEFWNHTRDGLAVLAAPAFFRVYLLQRPVPERVVVADSFHTKPLLRILQSADRYQILGLTRERVRLFEGNRDSLDEIKPAPNGPLTIGDALGEEHTEPYHAVFSYGTGPGGTGMHHGSGARTDDLDLDTERFFRAVDRAVLEGHSRPSGLPLLIAALPEYHKLFREVSQNPHVMAEGLEVDPRQLSAAELNDRAWKVVLPQYVARLAALVERFETARAHGKGTGDVAEAGRAAVEGRVRTLLVDADQVVPGRLHTDTGRSELTEPSGVDDLLDDIGEQVLKKGGEVVVVPSEQMPTKTGIAAEYFFAT
jgi:hypothetical protein